jgi:glycosyltransferase involved in cell wall biosynthesis
MQFWEGAPSIERDGVWLHGVCRARALYDASGKRSRVQPLIFAWGLFRTLLRNQAGSLDVIDAVAFPYFSLFAIAAWRQLTRANVFWIVTWLEVWGPDYWKRYVGNGPVARFGAWIERRCSKMGDRHVCISQHQSARLRELLRVPPDHIEVIPRGLDLDDLPSATSTAGRILYLGRLLDYKNVSVVVRALPGIRAQRRDATLRIVGSGPDEGALRALVAELELQDAVAFAPPKNDAADALREIAQATVLVQPSTREGLSMVVIEAQAIGTPVVAALHRESAVSDLIEHHCSGILVQEWDQPSAWRDALMQLLGDADLSRRLADAGRQAASVFDWRSSIIPRVEQLYCRPATRDR